MRSKQALPQRVLFFILMALLLAGACGYAPKNEEVILQLRVRPDGSGIVHIDISLQTLRELWISSCKALIERSSSSIPKEKIQVEERPSEDRCRLSVHFQNFQELRSHLEETNTVRRLTLDPGNRRFEIDMDVDVNFEKTEFILDLPGTPLQHNAHEARGRQLIWRWTGSSYSPRKERIWASSTVEPEMISPGLLVLIVILMGVAALGFLFLRQGGLPRLSVSRAPAQRFCPHCGAPLLPGARFCSHCGRPV